MTWTGEWDTPGDAIAAGASSAQAAAVTAMMLALARKGMAGLLVRPHFEGASISVISVRAGGFEPPRCRHQQDLNLPRMPFRHAREGQRGGLAVSNGTA